MLKTASLSAGGIASKNREKERKIGPKNLQNGKMEREPATAPLSLNL
jgi:hypothetical protein